MRIWGYVVLVLGIVFLILFTLADFGGGHLGVIPFFISAFLILIGRRLIKSGGGIVQAKPSAAAMEYPGAASAPATAPTPGHAAAPAAQTFTVEMPLTPEVAAVIAAQSARLRRNLIYVVIGAPAFFVLLGIVLAAANVAPGQNRTILAIFTGIGVATAALVYGISWLTVQKPVRRDLRGSTYLRTTGPVQVVSISSGGMLRLADRAFLMDRRNGMAELSKMPWGRIDYSPHGHVILAAWDADGRSIYTLPGYTVGSGAHGA